MHDWRKAIRAPISYSVPGSNSTLLRQQTNFVSFVVVTGAFLLLTLYTFMPQSRSTYSALDDEHGHGHGRTVTECECLPTPNGFNHTYPLTRIETLSDGRLKYRIGAVADLDKKSRRANKADNWLSYILYGNFIIDPQSNKVEIVWNSEEQNLSSDYSAGGRGMELSDLVVFNGKLYTCDDRTGIVYELQNSMLLPWVILRNGDGRHSPRGFKCEWMAVKDEHLYVGGLGKEWTSANGDVVLNNDPQWVKRISSTGQIDHIDWKSHYNEMRSTAGIAPPGYLIHEAAVWSGQKSRWYFLPRRASKQAYDDLLDEKRGTNILLTADHDFTTINLTQSIGPLIATHGFSSVKLMPLPQSVKLEPAGSEIAIALKSEEDGDVISTYVTVFRFPDGQVLFPETQFSSKHKYEGIEFV